ncbi:MAG: replicative DNA helicase [Acetobacteraceae bacterium]|nr:replicative DNA helicase [Acetobacteraceae bacterium]
MPPILDQFTRDLVGEAPLAGLAQRLPPQNLEAEQALLGAILTNNRAFERVAEYLAPGHFADPVHGRIFEAAGRRIGKGQIADAVTLKGDLANDPLLEEVGGAGYLGQLVAASVTIVNAGDYGRAIFDSHLRRQLIDLGEEVVNAAFAPEAGMAGEQQIEAAEQRLFELATTGLSERSFVPFTRAATMAVEAANNAFRKTGHVSGIATGLADLDKQLGGLHPSDLVILAGRPGMGKTSLATCMAVGAARTQLADVERGAAETAKSIAFFSLEMSAEQLATRILSEECSISSDRIRRGAIEHGEFDRFYQASVALQSLPLLIDDTPALSIAAMRTRARRLARGPGLAMIIVDYLQLMRPAPGRQPENRVLEISQITQGLKALAKELGVPVLALSQLSRAVEGREDKRPQLSDLRESGTIEQDADVVMFVYRDEYYLEQRRPKEAQFEDHARFETAHDKWSADMAAVHNKAEVIIGKQRHGPTGTVQLFFEGEFTRFANLDLMHAEEPRR